jgi:hypothetical protein
LVLKELEKGPEKIKINRGSVSDSINFLMNMRKGEINQNQASNKQYLITIKDSRRTKGNTSQSPSLVESTFFCYEKSYPMDKLRSPLDKYPFFGPNIEVKKWFLHSL